MLPAIRENIMMLPLISAAAFGMGILFDGGYFLGIDINIYTLFGLDEHLLFALAATPLFVASILASFPALIMLGRITLDKEEFSESSQKTLKALRWAKNLTIVFVFFLSQILFLYYRNIFNVSFTFAAFSFFFFTLLVQKFDNMHIERYRMLLVLWFMAGSPIALGFDMSRSYVRSGAGPFDIGKTCQSCRLIRSGSRGILFTLGDGSITYVKWDNIDSISIVNDY